MDLEEYQKITSKANDLDVLSSWYLINEAKHLIPFENENHFFINIENYVATVATPMVDQDTKALYFPKNDFQAIEEDILRILNEH